MREPPCWPVAPKTVRTLDMMRNTGWWEYLSFGVLLLGYIDSTSMIWIKNQLILFLQVKYDRQGVPDQVG